MTHLNRFQAATHTPKKKGPTREPTHIFFDIGGVLGTNGWDREQRARAMERFKLDADEFQCRHEEIGGTWESGRVGIDEYLDTTVFYTPREFTRGEFTQFMYSQSVGDDGAIAIARSLAKTGRYRMMTMNNESDELNRYRIEHFGISKMFDAFLSSCWLGLRKPTHAFFERALSIAQADPATSLFIDDREQNLTPARALGMNVILFKSAQQLRSDLVRAIDLEPAGG